MENRLLDLFSTNPDILKKLNEVTDRKAAVDLLAKEIPGYTEDDFANDVKNITELQASKSSELNLDDLEKVAGGADWKSVAATTLNVATGLLTKFLS